MRYQLNLLVLFLLLCPFAALAQEGSPEGTPDRYEWPSDKLVLEKLGKWQDLKFGILIHWGLYSVPGIVESWNLCNEDWVVRPEGSTYEGYKQWYWGLAKDFNPRTFNPAQWADVAARCGMKYLIFTTKHHDGFCLYDSALTDFSIAKGPFGKDAAVEVFDAFRGRGFMTGAYFSKPDWHCEWFWNPYYATPDRNPNYKVDKHPDWWRKYVEYTSGQIAEVTSGRFGALDILWLDGGWITGSQVGLDSLIGPARKVSPGLICVDRTIAGPNENYETPERMVPAKQIPHPWESCMPHSDDWGWTPGARYKSARVIVNTLAEITAKGGCLVLGVGPTADGIIEEREVEILEAVGAWLNRNGEAIYGTRITPQYNDGNIWFTRSKDGTLMYAVYALPEGEQLPATISWKGNLPSGKVTLLSTGRKLKTTVKDGTVTVVLPRKIASDSIALKFNR